MIDLLYLTHNRFEMTKASMAALIKNTNWAVVDRLLLYDDASDDETREYLTGIGFPVKVEHRFGSFGSPVAVMVDYLTGLDQQELRTFAKIDNDTMVPAGWLNECIQVFAKHPELDLLGIEAFNPVVPGDYNRSFTDARFIGGIGLMRNEAFITLPRPRGRFGFTAWQEKTARVRAGWINPSIPVFLLDRIPREPWRSLSLEYIAKGWQRDWGPYDEKSKNLWSWWCE
jgi:hypothetical protein